MSGSMYAIYQPAAPFFNLIRGALGDLVDGDHFFDTVTESSIYEVRYIAANWPHIIKGRSALMGAFKSYVEVFAHNSADGLLVHKTEDGLIVLEYDIHGEVRATGAKYENRFCSIIKIENRKIAYWRDYTDTLAAENALTATP